jgi:hypothetical protein
MTTTIVPRPRAAEEQRLAADKRLALEYLGDAWDGAAAEGVDAEIVAHAALFRALAELVAVYGEEPVADLAATLPDRIRSMEFSLRRGVQ